MKYAKPEVVASTSALGVIASVQLDKTNPKIPDRQGSQFALSAGAYEADE
jgi:hypothetical protein